MESKPRAATESNPLAQYVRKPTRSLAIKAKRPSRLMAQ